MTLMKFQATYSAVLLLKTVVLIACDPHPSYKDNFATARNPNTGVMTTTCSNRIIVWRTAEQPDQYLIEHLVDSTLEKCHNELVCHIKENQGDASLKGNSLSEDSLSRNKKQDSLRIRPEGDSLLEENADVKEPCKCKTSNETFYAREIGCKYGFDQACPFCFSTSPTQPIMLNLMQNTKNLPVGRLMRCKGGAPIPPVRILTEKELDESTEGESENCKVSEIEYENIDVNEYSKWRVLNTIKSKFKFDIQGNILKWTGNTCELQSLSGLVLKIKIKCANEMEPICIIIKTEGKSTVLTDKPNKIQEDFDKCQEEVSSQVATITPTPSPRVKEKYTKTIPEEIVSSRGHFSTGSLKSQTTSTEKLTDQSKTIKKNSIQSESIYERISQSRAATENFDQSTSDIVPPLESLMVISAADITKASLFVKMDYYPNVNTHGNNGVLILIASITAAISLVMIFVTVLLVLRRDRREKGKTKEDYSNSEYSTYGDDRSRSESMFEVARKIYIVEKRGSIDHNLNVGTPPDSILKTSRKEGDIDSRGNEIRPRNKTKNSFLSTDLSSGNQGTQTEDERPKRKETCDCATYTEHDIPTLVAASIGQLKDPNDSKKAYHRRRKTWNWFESSKKSKGKKSYDIKQKSKEKNEIIEVNLQKMKKISQTSTESFSNPIHDEIKAETESRSRNSNQITIHTQTASTDLDGDILECGIDNEAYSRSESVNLPSPLQVT
uniref:Cnidarian restricted protein n=1 Tax=Clytia hemisphaerica TaxID=252671 RepID=A0A7M5X442_9CNID